MRMSLPQIRNRAGPKRKVQLRSLRTTRQRWRRTIPLLQNPQSGPQLHRVVAKDAGAVVVGVADEAVADVDARKLCLELSHQRPAKV